MTHAASRCGSGGGPATHRPGWSKPFFVAARRHPTAERDQKGRIGGLLVVFAFVLATGACAPNPARAQAVAALDTLDSVHLQLTGRKPVSGDPCSDVGGVRGKLYAVVGPSDLPSAWQPLSDATGALTAACGQLGELGLPSSDDAVVAAARVEWQRGAQHELSLACQDIQTAASRLNRPTPACQP